MNDRRPVKVRFPVREYPFYALRVGDWFDVPQDVASRASVASCASQYARRHKGHYFQCSEVRNAEGRKVTRVVRITKGKTA